MVVPSESRHLLEFLDSSPSPFHAVATARNSLIEAGFDVADYSSVAVQHFGIEKGAVARGGALVAWSWPSSSVRPGSLIVGAHTDSPGLRLKPNPLSSGAGMALLEVEIYGGVLLNSWLDRDLGIAGMVHLSDGTSRLVDTRRAVARIPQLAIHLDRDVNEKGLVLNRQNHLRPVLGSATATLERLLEGTGLASTDDVAGFELGLYDVTPAALVGAVNDLVASGRLDNLVSCWAAIDALVRVSVGVDRPLIVALFDHEEVGSESITGAAGPLLETVVDELLAARGMSGDRFDFLRHSLCLSADNAHALHPNYPERHDSNHAPLVNRGPALKFNANQRYATTAAAAARVEAVARAAGIPTQRFASNNAMPCGSTIGPITATRLGIETVDIGVPQLAMHSARETCGTLDPPALRDLIVALATA